MNRLITERSEYLRAHAHQPVDWYPWGEEAFARAWQEQKPLIISIGYSSCHWCHVMSRESFEDKEVARLMNQYFICIKVDREERPDVDQVYMDAILLMGRSGGWPLNCFALPDGRPFYAVTYLPKKEWINLLRHIAKLYAEKQDEVHQMAQRVVEAIQKMDESLLKSRPLTLSPVQVNWHEIIQKLLQDIDWVWGGEWSQMKFPMPSRWIFALRAGILLEKPELVRAVHLTLQKMAMGGIFDPIDGGFMRYTTDRFWRVPHFEKMLCDNGLLLALYSEAYRHQPNRLYQQVIEKTAAFLLEKMRLPTGLFSASFSAESEGEEGLYYTWTYEELENILTDPQAKRIFFAAHGVFPEGNWEKGRNILYRTKDNEAIAQEMGLPQEAVENLLEEAYKNLAAVRGKRPSPPRDEAAIIAWNAYAVIGLIEAYRALGRIEYLAAARSAIHALLEDNLTHLHRIQKEKAWYGEAFAEDYAAFALALIHLYTVTGTESYLLQAAQLMERSLELFYDEKEGLFYFTAQALRGFIGRRKDIFDTSTPSSNSLFSEVLWWLSRYFHRMDYREKVHLILSRLEGRMRESPTLASFFLRVALLEHKAPFSVIYRGSDISPLWKRYEPAIGWVAFISQEETAIPACTSYAASAPPKWFLCTYGACLPPVETIDQLWDVLEREKARLASN
ncbi:MAG: thioredoxin domain-containing protein [Bacteroidia bacterium]|nr:thioredoxin domain-containing protein [Bacteroidia bacterium]MDW8015473.1 thioredoxin domain-containing protein [Bacteroidia bacterium]